MSSHVCMYTMTYMHTEACTSVLCPEPQLLTRSLFSFENIKSESSPQWPYSTSCDNDSPQNVPVDDNAGQDHDSCEPVSISHTLDCRISFPE